MPQRHRAYRLLGVLAMLVQLTLPGTLAFADAMLERASGGAAAAHVEDHSRASCHRVHTDDCVLCRSLQHLSAPRGAPAHLPASESTFAGRIALAANRRLPEPWAGPPPSRGPPA